MLAAVGRPSEAPEEAAGGCAVPLPGFVAVIAGVWGAHPDTATSMLIKVNALIKIGIDLNCIKNLQSSRESICCFWADGCDTDAAATESYLELWEGIER